VTPRRLSDSERLAWLRLARTETVGPVAFDHLIQRFGTAERALIALPDLARRAGRASPLRPPPQDEILQELETGARLGARLICACEPDFPSRLAALDPPPVLWTLGQAELLPQPSLAIVGARIASAGGQRFARQLAAELGQHGYVVVSGLARGVDGAAHEGALATGTVAVLGGGVTDIYPPEHAALHARIAGEGGCVVSESAPDRRAIAKDFPRRNRIISGLALGVIVVEAELKSGSLITARLAAEQGRDVFAVPGSPLDPRAKGPNDLIRQGAILCEGVEDVLRSLSGQAHLRERERPYAAEDDGGKIDHDALREAVAALLSPTPVSRDELVRATRAPTSAVMAALVELALAERAELLPGGMVAGI